VSKLGVYSWISGWVGGWVGGWVVYATDGGLRWAWGVCRCGWVGGWVGGREGGSEGDGGWVVSTLGKGGKTNGRAGDKTLVVAYTRDVMLAAAVPQQQCRQQVAHR
jgi:hypothetical protein